MFKSSAPSDNSKSRIYLVYRSWKFSHFNFLKPQPIKCRLLLQRLRFCEICYAFKPHQNWKKIINRALLKRPKIKGPFPKGPLLGDRIRIFQGRPKPNPPPLLRLCLRVWLIKLDERFVDGWSLHIHHDLKVGSVRKPPNWCTKIHGKKGVVARGVTKDPTPNSLTFPKKDKKMQVWFRWFSEISGPLPSELAGPSFVWSDRLVLVPVSNQLQGEMRWVNPEKLVVPNYNLGNKCNQDKCKWGCYLALGVKHVTVHHQLFWDIKKLFASHHEALWNDYYFVEMMQVKKFTIAGHMIWWDLSLGES